MPDPAGATPPLDEAGCAALKGFLEWVRDHSTSAVIITSRAPEGWLGQVRRIGVGGLNRAEAAQYAEPSARPLPGRAGAAGAPVVRGTAGLAGRPPPGDAAHPAPPRHHQPRRPAGRAAGHHPPARRGRPGRGPDHLASGEHHLLLRPPGRADAAAAAGGQPVPRRRRRGRPDALLRRGGGAGPVRRCQQAGVDGGAARTRPGSGCSPASARACTGSTRRCPATSPPAGTPRTPPATARSGRPASRPCAPPAPPSAGG